MSPEPSATSAATGASIEASAGSGSVANIVRTMASTTCGRTARTTWPAAVSTTASRGEPLLVGVPGARDPSPGGRPRKASIEAQHLGRLVEAALELGVGPIRSAASSSLPAAVDEDQVRETAAGRRCAAQAPATCAPKPWPARTTGSSRRSPEPSATATASAASVAGS